MIGTGFLARQLVAYAAGLITAPLIKPVVRGTAKGTVKVGLHAKKLAGDAAAELQELAAEASADLRTPPTPSPVATVPAKRYAD